MEDYKNFLELENQGSILYIHADKHNIFIVYEDMEDARLYLFALDKGFFIEAVHELRFPEEFKDADVEWLHWFNPRQTDIGTYVFRGVLSVDDVICHFQINDKAEIILSDEEVQTNYNSVTQALHLENPYIGDMVPEVFVRKQGKTHIAGVIYDNKDQPSQVYCVVDTDKESCLKRYTLHSDVGEINVNAITVDTHDKRVYLAGEINRFNADGSYQTSTPYLEMFLN